MFVKSVELKNDANYIFSKMESVTKKVDFWNLSKVEVFDTNL